jgi:hypothetical protein
LQQGGRSFTGPFGLSGLDGPRVLPLLCPVDDCLSAWRGGGGGFLQRGCQAIVPNLDDVVYLHWPGRMLVPRSGR